MKTRALILLLSFLTAPASAEGPEDQIRAKTSKFALAIVSKDLSILDEIFDKDPTNVFYDINEGPLTGFDRLKRVWTAAVTNYSIKQFGFLDDMKIFVRGDQALQTASWTQTQENRSGQSREIKGRATILWRKQNGEWRVWHYHASVTPARNQPMIRPASEE